MAHEASPLAIAKERIGERMASRAFEIRNAAEKAEAELFGAGAAAAVDEWGASARGPIVSVADGGGLVKQRGTGRARRS